MRIHSLIVAVVVVLSGAFQAVHAADRTINLTVNPLGLALGSANMNADFAVTESLTVGPSLSYSSYKSTGVTATSTTATAYGMGVNVNWFMGNKALTDSWFLNPFFMYAKATSNLNTSASGTTFGANIGYWWFWESGINLGLGLGVQQLNIDLSSIGLGGISGTLPSAILQFGYSF